MATIVTNPPSSTNCVVGWTGLFTFPGYSQGEDGKLVRDEITQVTQQWCSESAFVQTVLTGVKGEPPPNRSMKVAGLFAMVSVFLMTAGFLWGAGGILFPIAAMSGLGAYAFLARWLARQKNPSGFIRFAERIRQVLAYEGDPDWQKK